jgi:hypothetical protein
VANLVPIAHDLTLAFDAPGTKTIRVRSRNVRFDYQTGEQIEELVDNPFHVLVE